MIQSQITPHKKNNGNPEMTEILELSDNNVEAAIIIMLNEVRKNSARSK